MFEAGHRRRHCSSRAASLASTLVSSEQLSTSPFPGCCPERRLPFRSSFRAHDRASFPSRFSRVIGDWVAVSCARLRRAQSWGPACAYHERHAWEANNCGCGVQRVRGAGSVRGGAAGGGAQMCARRSSDAAVCARPSRRLEADLPVCQRTTCRPRTSSAFCATRAGSLTPATCTRSGMLRT